MSGLATLLVRLDGPLQSWGVASRYSRRDTLDAPSKSGVVGLCAAALGRPRTASVADLAALRFGVLVVDPGRPVEDYHTVANVVRASTAKRVDVHPGTLVRILTAREVARAGPLPSVGDNTGGLKANEITRRTYLADAAFVAGLEGSRAVLEEVRTALTAPRYLPGLGRASCLPSAPLAFVERDDGGLVDASLEEALGRLAGGAGAWLEARQPSERERTQRREGQRIIVECNPAEATLRFADQPTDTAYLTRRFATRYARTLDMEVAGA